jgi:hypothetical protein
VPRASAIICSSLLVISACTEADEPFPQADVPPPRTLGTLEYRWTINGERDPAACAAAGATQFQSLLADGGFIVESISVACDDFEASLPLYTDDFRARSALVNVEGFPVLRRIVEDLFVIEEDHVTRLVIDFPSPPLPFEPDAGAIPAGSGPDAGAPPGEVPGVSDAGLFDAGTP